MFRYILFSFILWVGTDSIVTASTISSLPGKSTVTGFGNSFPAATYHMQTFVALSDPLESVTVPVAGPAAFRILVTETRDDGRPTNVLFESADVIVPAPARPATFFFGSSIAGFAWWLNANGDRTTAFNYPVSTIPSDTPVWHQSFGNDFALCLHFDDGSSGNCDSQTLLTTQLVTHVDGHERVIVNFGGLNLVAGETYGIVIDGAILPGHFNPIPEPSTFMLLALGAIGLVGSRGRRRRRHARS